jgi:hypothetical protein
MSHASQATAHVIEQRKAHARKDGPNSAGETVLLAY